MRSEQTSDGWWARLALVACLMALGTIGPGACARRQALASGDRVEQAKLDFTVKDLSGKDVRLADYRGRPLVINFWATWCGPCKLEIPALVELVEKYKKDDFTVLGISTDDTPEDLRKFADAYRVNYPILIGLGHDELIEAYDAEFGIPVSWFIRRDGTVALKRAGTETKAWFEQQIKSLF